MIKTILVVFLISVGFSQQEWNRKYIEDYGGISYAPNSKKPYSGKVYSFHKDGKMKLEGRYKNGLQNGLWIWWYENGKKNLEITFKDGEKISKMEWYQDGSLKNTEVAIISTEYGNMVIEFFEEKAPKHVESFKLHVKNGYYDGTIFHRVIPGFMIQGGDPNTKGNNTISYGMGGNSAKYYGIGNEDDSSTWTLPAEFSEIKHKLGVVSMARSNDPNSGGSQFFICAANVPHLDGKYTVFGQVVEGLEIIDKIINLPRDARDNPNRRIEIKVDLK